MEVPSAHFSVEKDYAVSCLHQDPERQVTWLWLQKCRALQEQTHHGELGPRREADSPQNGSLSSDGRNGLGSICINCFALSGSKKAAQKDQLKRAKLVGIANAK